MLQTSRRSKQLQQYHISLSPALVVERLAEPESVAVSTPLPIFTEQSEDFDPLPPFIADLHQREVSPLKVMQNCKFHQHLTSIFHSHIIDKVFEGIGDSKGVYCGHGVCGGCQPGRASIREVRVVSQLQNVSRQINLPTISHLNILSHPPRRCT
jgi:hypothetical protein